MKIAYVVFLFLSLNLAHAKEEPPQVFVDKGACPFECCTYRDWTVRAEIKLTDKPNGTKTVGIVKKGEVVTALTGEVNVIPIPMEIVFNHGKFKVGDKVYLLTPGGEGYYKVWSNGVITDEEVMFFANLANEDKTCSKPTKECWGRVSGQQKNTWWIQIRQKNGNTGWTKESDEFDNKDACG